MAEVAAEKRKRGANKYWRTVKGKLYARLQYKDDLGTYREKLRPLEDKRKARSVVDEMRRELEVHGEEALQEDKVTFKQLAEKYKAKKVFPAVIRNGIKTEGLKSVKPVETYVKIATDYFGNRKLRKLKRSDIEDFKRIRLNTPVNREVNEKVWFEDENGKKKSRIEKRIKTTPRKVASVNRELATLRAMLNFAQEEGYILKNPFPAKAISGAAEVERDFPFSNEDERKLMEQCTGIREHLKPIVICALDTAMRPDEIFKLVWSDVDFTMSNINVRAENSKIEKSRNVPMSKRLTAELRKLWQTSAKDLNASVFGTKSVKKAFNSAVKLAGIDGFRFRDCRHVGTKRLLLAGLSEAEVMKITGHTQMKTFLRYVNLTPENIAAKASLLDTYLEAQQPKAEAVSAMVN